MVRRIPDNEWCRGGGDHLEGCLYLSVGKMPFVAYRQLIACPVKLLSYVITWVTYVIAKRTCSF